jgi:hypothetical protein
VSIVSSPPTPETVTGARSAVHSDAVPAPSLRHSCDPWLRIGAQVLPRFPLPGQPGHGRTAFVRRRPVRIVDGRKEGGYTDAFELICPSCGDHPYLDFVDVPAQLQWLRGPYVLAVALAVYEEHLGLSTGPDQDSHEGSGIPAAASGPILLPRAEAANGDSPPDTVTVTTIL